ncbi:MAG: hypothetical protein EA405_11850 [Rhodospirillales bacterium]|nr:MAG: hypothetical protein EA405_11850 [Rhodospirillales bacterium]
MTTTPAEVLDAQVGDPAIDHDHKLIEELILALREAIVSGDNEAQAELGEALVRHVRTHFAVEELLMRLYRYPGAAAHAEEHAAVRDRLKRIAWDLTSGDTDAALRDLDELLAWRTTHMTEADVAYRQYLCATGIFRSGA